MRVGKRRGSHTTFEPQRVQKWKQTGKPLADGRSNVAKVPLFMCTFSRSKNTAMLKALPVRRWQSAQWHIEIFRGAPTHSTRASPQWQRAVLVSMSLDRSQASAKAAFTSPFPTMQL
jgi:hypothetical protein